MLICFAVRLTKVQYLNYSKAALCMGNDQPLGEASTFVININV